MPWGCASARRMLDGEGGAGRRLRGKQEEDGDKGQKVSADLCESDGCTPRHSGGAGAKTGLLLATCSSPQFDAPDINRSQSYVCYTWRCYLFGGYSGDTCGDGELVGELWEEPVETEGLGRRGAQVTIGRVGGESRWGGRVCGDRDPPVETRRDPSK